MKGRNMPVIMWIGQGHELSFGNNRNLDKCGREAGLEDLINPNHRFIDGGRVIPPRTMSATVEALIGTMFVDSGENMWAVKAGFESLEGSGIKLRSGFGCLALLELGSLAFDRNFSDCACQNILSGLIFIVEDLICGRPCFVIDLAS
jgi:hypothetical protein